MPPAPYTFEELRHLIPKLERELATMERDEAALGNFVRPCPPLTLQEVRELLLDLVDAAASRPLTRSELYLHGQLLCVHEHAARAEVLGKKGRYFVIGEETLSAADLDHPRSDP